MPILFALGYYGYIPPFRRCLMWIANFDHTHPLAAKNDVSFYHLVERLREMEEIQENFGVTSGLLALPQIV